MSFASTRIRERLQRHADRGARVAGSAMMQSMSRHLTSVWLNLGSRRERRRPRPPATIWDNRKRLIEDLAPGKTFLDVGGIFNIAGDVAFWAEEAGATEVMIFDGMDPSLEFQAKMKDRPTSKVRFRQGDLHAREDVEQTGEWDVVWCAGVIYHSPHPYLQLLHCRQMAGETLLLGTHLVPEVPGIENACVWYPGRGQNSMRAFAAWYGETSVSYPGASYEFDRTPDTGYGNMWWGLTQSAVESMIRYAGFEIVETYRYSPDFVDILARVSDPPDFIPSPGFSRERGRRLRAGMKPEPPAWWVAPTGNDE